MQQHEWKGGQWTQDLFKCYSEEKTEFPSDLDLYWFQMAITYEKKVYRVERAKEHYMLANHILKTENRNLIKGVGSVTHQNDLIIYKK